MVSRSGVVLHTEACTLQVVWLSMREYVHAISDVFTRAWTINIRDLALLAWRMVWIHDLNAGGNQDGEEEGPKKACTPQVSFFRRAWAVNTRDLAFVAFYMVPGPDTGAGGNQVGDEKDTKEACTFQVLFFLKSVCNQYQRSCLYRLPYGMDT